MVSGGFNTHLGNEEVMDRFGVLETNPESQILVDTWELEDCGEEWERRSWWRRTLRGGALSWRGGKVGPNKTCGKGTRWRSYRTPMNG